MPTPFYTSGTTIQDMIARDRPSIFKSEDYPAMPKIKEKTVSGVLNPELPDTKHTLR